MHAGAAIGLLAMAVAVGARAPDPRAIDAGTILVEQEPQHLLAFANEHVRVFDVRVPSGSGRLSHQHLSDTVIVTIAPERPDPGSATSPGSAVFAAKGESEAIARSGTSEQRFVEVELLTSVGPGVRAVSGEPDHVLEIENGRVRVYRVRLDPGDSIPVHTHAGAWLAVTIAGAPGPGTYRWYDTGDANPLTAGQYRLEIVEVEPK